MMTCFITLTSLRTSNVIWVFAPTYVTLAYANDQTTNVQNLQNSGTPFQII